MSVIYQFTKEVNSPRLQNEIQNSSITVALDYIQTNGSDLKVYFKSSLSSEEEDVLDGIVSSHVNSPLPGTPDPTIISELPPAEPFAKPSYRTKRSAIETLMKCAPGESKVIDCILLEERHVYGGAIIVHGGVLGDYVQAEVNDVSGFIPVPYRAPLCEAYPIVARYIEKEFLDVKMDGYAKLEIDMRPLVAKITPGLSLRVIYNATSGGGDRDIVVNYGMAKKL